MQHLPYPLYTAEQTRQLDRIASEQHAIPAATLMTRAGTAALNFILTQWPDAKQLLILCGSGNNAGDGYEVARQALEKHCKVVLVEVGRTDKMSDEATAARQAYLATGAEPIAFDGVLPVADMIVDALFGTGLDRDITGAFAQAIDAINHVENTPVLSLDIPSGIHADTGKALGIAVHATATLSFIGLNIGLFNGDAPNYTGHIVFDALAVPDSVFEAIEATTYRLDLDHQATLKLAPRQRTSHKGHFGHLLVIGGNLGMSGAPRIAAEAATRVGAGLVSIATHPSHSALINLTRPELMSHGVEIIDELTPLLTTANVVTIGPGLGQTQWSQALSNKAIESKHPMVVDADALNLLSRQPQQNPHWILTPHPGEAARLLGCSTKTVQENRLDAVRQLHARYGGIIVLKGAGTLIYNGEDPIRLSPCGNPGMASGGMGDALAGIIGGLLAQNFSLMGAACIGVTIHGMAADKAAEQDGERGMLAMDLMPHLRHLVNLKF
ncbi:NAD(P)HX epimerase/NAD(P)HX dehydratase [Methylophaga thiooxydans]|uniref:Bifunctional NAD(P)H-hydrate repair enzyme n=1 Tax=Methylophaga thiooxydans TaxID=392484 RepID=A0A0A0BDV6_9GAMM|nr:bifunctional ADP-dependent NAD(P)H-hydrate dehydratase/NAD(P)H-hydrate epimerase [Methylophaga thiooxydans]KGM05887.1 NAD(P)HX epimerase/NAD(P)HX dehydratase [Methylophaga thiooxydans]